MKTKIISIIALSVFLLGANPSFASTYGVQVKTANCTANQTLPDPACTPGAVLTTNIKTICTVGYTKTVRDVSTATKKKVFKEYGISYSDRSNYEIDHLISLELGGSNDISNLFPESHLITNNSFTKDAFENYLHKQVCSGKISITEAQHEIATDWVTYNNSRLNPAKATTKTIVSVPQKVEAPITQIITPVVQTPPATFSSDPAVKKSTTGICHAIGTTYYSRTTNYTAYSSIADCLASGGRLPK